MTVRLDGEVIRLEGHCRVEDAEALVAQLQRSARSVDLTGCDRLHAALAQALLAFGVEPCGAPCADFIRDHLAPALGRSQ